MVSKEKVSEIKSHCALSLLPLMSSSLLITCREKKIETDAYQVH